MQMDGRIKQGVQPQQGLSHIRIPHPLPALGFEYLAGFPPIHHVSLQVFAEFGVGHSEKVTGQDRLARDSVEIESRRHRG